MIIILLKINNKQLSNFVHGDCLAMNSDSRTSLILKEANLRGDIQVDMKTGSDLIQVLILSFFLLLQERIGVKKKDWSHKRPYWQEKARWQMRKGD